MILDSERLDDLEYKGLKILQDPNGYCFTSDSVLLSSLLNIKKSHTVIDLCTGSGIVAILSAAKYSPNRVYGIELQPRLADMAKRSVKLNNLENIIEIINADVINIDKVLGAGIADVIMINPPYEKAVKKDNYTEKDICKSEVFLTASQAINSAAKLLKYGGLFYMVNKIKRLADVFCYMRENNIEPKKLYLIQPKASKDIDTFIVEGKKGARSDLIVPAPIIVYEEDGSFSEISRRLYNK